MENFEIRILLLHYWKKEFKAAEAAKKICVVEEEDVVLIHTVQKWFKKFNEGHTDLRDEARLGRPITGEPIHQPVLGDCRQNSIYYKYQLFDIITQLERSTGVVDKFRMI